MNKKLLKQLVLISYKNGTLDKVTVSRIADKLDRAELKQYIKSLKNAEKLRNVYVENPFGLQKDEIVELKNIFQDKNIVDKNNPELIIGTRIIYNDDIFEMSLKSSLDSIVEKIENYD